MVEIWMTQAIVFGAAFLGTLTRTLLPYWDKLREMPELVFEKKFLGTAAIALATSAVMAATLFTPMMELVSAAGDATLAAVFFIVFTASLGTNEIINQFIRSRLPGEIPTTTTTPTTTEPATPAA
jgi:hypothetical protein